MEITVAVIITAITLIAGEITKLTNLDNKWIPLQNIIIAVVASIVCILFKVQDMGVLETVVTCIFATMSARWYCRFKKDKGGKVKCLE